jgi:diguanylate cyclase
LRDGDIAGRYGGEEFGIILPGTKLDVAKSVAGRIREAVMARDVRERNSGETLGRITISIGVAQLRPGEASTSFMRRADACLYAAKRAGRNRVIAEDDHEFVPA